MRSLSSIPLWSAERHIRWKETSKFVLDNEKSVERSSHEEMAPPNVVTCKSPSLTLPIVFLSLLATSTFLPAVVVTVHEHDFIETSTIAEKSILEPKLISHLHFYFHDIPSGRNPTAVPIVKPAIPSKSFFGTVVMIDDPLTVGPEPDSKRIGYAQGMYSLSSQREVALLMTLNLYFTEGKYNGSALSVLGRNAPLQPVREMPVVGGSGLFRLARGYALARTHMLNITSGDAILEYNVTVMHY